MAVNFRAVKNQHLDTENALERFLNDKDILIEAIGIYCEDAPGRLSKMNEILIERNLELLSQEAHKLKSESGTVGAVMAQKLCEQLELCALKSDLDLSRKIFKQVSGEVKTVLELFSQQTRNDF